MHARVDIPYFILVHIEMKHFVKYSLCHDLALTLPDAIFKNEQFIRNIFQTAYNALYLLLLIHVYFSFANINLFFYDKFSNLYQNLMDVTFYLCIHHEVCIFILVSFELLRV